MDLRDVAMFAIDETSFKRTHKDVTPVIGAAKRRVPDAEDGRGMETVRKFAEKLTAKGGNPEKITAVTSGMPRAFLPAIAENFPNAENIIGKFRVKKVLIDAPDDVRKAEQRVAEDKTALFRGRRLFMIPEAKLTAGQSAALAEMSKRYPKTGRHTALLRG
jgi:transposase